MLKNYPLLISQNKTPPPKLLIGTHRNTSATPKYFFNINLYKRGFLLYTLCFCKDNDVN